MGPDQQVGHVLLCCTEVGTEIQTWKPFDPLLILLALLLAVAMALTWRQGQPQNSRHGYGRLPPQSVKPTPAQSVTG
ncbi:MAG: hypothetical protein C0614_07645 [Desulfuromonas sp.]|nr:MAG: hypothetical protein C0614_07645 [Desulfuromonas sp.]